MPHILVYFVIFFAACYTSHGACLPISIPNNVSTVVGKYASYVETVGWYGRLEDAHSNLVKLIAIGETYEGRFQMVMRLSPEPKDTLPAVFVEAGMHPREWLSPATANFLIEKMIEGYNTKDPWYLNAFRKYVFYFISITNPDGYVFSFDKSNPSNRFWRKNRRVNSNGCVGVDLNRNWDVSFGGGGTSNNPCDNTYRGQRAFSEPETENLRRFAEKTFYKTAERPGLQLYISLHTYGQLWVVPYSFRTERPEPWEKDYELHRAALVASDAITKATGAFYNVKNGARKFGITTGGSDDWMLHKMKARYSYTLELRPGEQAAKGLKAFEQPDSEIVPTGNDALAALKALVDTMKSH